MGRNQSFKGNGGEDSDSNRSSMKVTFKNPKKKEIKKGQNVTTISNMVVNNSLNTNGLSLHDHFERQNVDKIR